VLYSANITTVSVLEFHCLNNSDELHIVNIDHGSTGSVGSIDPTF